MDDFRKKLLFQAWHRGTREMDLLLGRFAEEILPEADDRIVHEFTQLLQHSDVDLYDWITGKSVLQDSEPRYMLRMLKDRYV